MQRHKARISWHRGDDDFVGRRYSRAHEWKFDGGASVAASASPSNVPEPYSVPEAVDPEEALVAAVSSCHMLWFLHIAASGGYSVERYVDEAQGVIDRNAKGRLAFTEIRLNPQIEFSTDAAPTADELDAMHRQAHAECFVANSLNCDVVVGAANSAERGASEADR